MFLWSLNLLAIPLNKLLGCIREDIQRKKVVFFLALPESTTCMFFDHFVINIIKITINIILPFFGKYIAIFSANRLHQHKIYNDFF